MLIRELLEVGTGSIVELQKAAGEPVEVLVNGRLIARGEVVVVEDNFAVRITEILSPAERIQRLGA
jgi:flagellar motor switch protein FliN/FliY